MGWGDRPQSRDSAGLATRGSSLSPGSQGVRSAFLPFQASHCLKVREAKETREAGSGESLVQNKQ